MFHPHSNITDKNRGAAKNDFKIWVSFVSRSMHTSCTVATIILQLKSSYCQTHKIKTACLYCSLHTFHPSSYKQSFLLQLLFTSVNFFSCSLSLFFLYTKRDKQYGLSRYWEARKCKVLCPETCRLLQRHRHPSLHLDALNKRLLTGSLSIVC